MQNFDGLEAARYGAQEISPSIAQAAYDPLPEKLAQLQIDALVSMPVTLFFRLFPDRHAFRPGLGSSSYGCYWDSILLLFLAARDHAARVSQKYRGLKTIADTYPPILAVAQAYAEKVGLSIDWHDMGSIDSKLAIVTQIPKEFDFPGIPWPSQFHYTGPLHDGMGRESIELLKLSCLCVTHRGQHRAFQVDSPGKDSNLASFGSGGTLGLG